MTDETTSTTAGGSPLDGGVRRHSPGPWTAEPMRPDGHVWITSQTDPEFNELVLVAEVAPWNAPLIAAAPALLSAAEAWCAYLDGPGDGADDAAQEDRLMQNMRDAVRRTRAA